MDKIDHQYTDNIICPWCGYKFDDSWKFRDDNDELTCSECEKRFEYQRNIDVDYSTHRVGDCPHENMEQGPSHKIEWCDDCGLVQSIDNSKQSIEEGK